MKIHNTIKPIPRPRTYSNCYLHDTLDRLIMDSTLSRRHEVVFATGFLDDPTPSLMLDAPVLVVTTPTVYRHYGAAIERYFSRSGHAPQRRIEVLNVTEASKELVAVSQVCDWAQSMNLRRGGQMVAVGGGVCMDVVAFAASIFRRGVVSVKVPTTLIGLIDAGIGIKNGINFRGKKSALGSFYPPRKTVIDAGFLATLPEAQLRDGLSEALKMALIADPLLVQTLHEYGPTLVVEKMANQVGDGIIRSSIQCMLVQLSDNLFEVDGYERLVDFGHTFSPYVEAKSGYTISHGAAVAIDMAISTVIARELGQLSEPREMYILNIITRLGLPVHSHVLDAEEMHGSLANVVSHRDGQLNLVVPCEGGGCDFVRDLESVPSMLLQRCIDRLKEYQVS